MTTLVEKKFFVVTAVADGHKVYYGVANTCFQYWTHDPEQARKIRADECFESLMAELDKMAASSEMGIPGRSTAYIRGTVDESTMKLEPVRVCYFVG